MDTTIEQQDGTAIIRPAGRLDFGAAARFQEDVDAALAGGGAPPARVVIDASALEYVSSAGLRVFLLGARAAKNAGIVMAVCCLRPAVREVFQVSGFDRLIPVKETVAEAMTA